MVIGDPLVHLASAGLLALLLGSSGMQKLRNRSAFVQVLQRYGLGQGWRRALAFLLPVGEILSAAGLILCLKMPWLAAPAVVLLGLYAGVLAISVRRGEAIEDCGCHFGGKPQPPSVALVWRNLLLTGLALNLVLPATGRPLAWLDVLTLFFLLISATALYGLAHLLMANHAALRKL